MPELGPYPTATRGASDDTLGAFSPTLLFDFYGTTGHKWGLSPLDDQHVAGLVMALEQSIVMGIALAWLFARMLAESEAEEQRAERFANP